jgi:hypothetical protein
MSSNWWANKLGSTPAPRPQPVAPQAQPQQQQPVYQQPPSYPTVQQTVPLSERCPGCGSNNYGGATPESRKRCYDCGYPIVQSGTGVSGVNSPRADGPTQAAKQVQAGGFNPNTIIGHI